MNKSIPLLLGLFLLNVYADNAIVKPTKYNEVRLGKGDYGHLVSIESDKVKIKETLNLACFYVIDYLEAENVTQETLKKNNPKNLPWCEDPSGGTYFKVTGKTLTFKIDEKTKFYSMLEKRIKNANAVKELNEYKDHIVSIQARKGSPAVADTVKLVYTD